MSVDDEFEVVDCTQCAECGALVSDDEAHLGWHQAVSNLLKHLVMDAARRDGMSPEQFEAHLADIAAQLKADEN